MVSDSVITVGISEMSKVIPHFYGVTTNRRRIVFAI